MAEGGTTIVGDGTRRLKTESGLQPPFGRFDQIGYFFFLPPEIHEFKIGSWREVLRTL